MYGELLGFPWPTYKKAFMFLVLEGLLIYASCGEYSIYILYVCTVSLLFIFIFFMCGSGNIIYLGAEIMWESEYQQLCCDTLFSRKGWIKIS